MADEDVATRAPESDLHSSSTPPPATTDIPLSPPASSPESSPGMGEHCTTDRPLPASSGSPTGDLTTLNSISCYISKPSSYPSSPCKLLLLLTGGTGIHSANNQLQADTYASRGFVVIMPDQFAGKPAPGTASATTGAFESQSSPGLLERIRLGAMETAKSFIIDMWLARHTPETVMPVLQKVLEGAREEFGDAVANGGGIYGAGYCFGAKYILLLCGEPPETVESDQKKASQDVEMGEMGNTNKGPQLRAGAIAHGTLVTVEDMQTVKSPVAIAAVENDSLFPDEIREKGRVSLERNGVEHEIKVFDGVPHGFAVVGDYKDNLIKEKQSEAFEMMCGWLEAH